MYTAGLPFLFRSDSGFQQDRTDQYSQQYPHMYHDQGQLGI